MEQRIIMMDEKKKAFLFSKKISVIITTLLIIAGWVATADAATIVLQNGATVTGTLIDYTEEQITIEDPATKQAKVIKTVFIKDMVLTDNEKRIVDRAKKKASGQTLPGDSLLPLLQPALGLMPGIAYPFGKLGGVVKIGFGGNLFFDLNVIPKPIRFQFRLGLSPGFLYHSVKGSDYSGSLMMIPVLLYAKFLYASDIGVRPYLKVGGGITPVMAGATSIDPTAAAAIGLGYCPTSLPYVEFFVEGGMMMAFESVRGDFITANIGVAYRFDSMVSGSGKK